LAKDTSPTNPIARIFKSDPHRELFNTLADTLERAVLVISGTEPRLITCNHAFLLLSGYARTDLDSLTPSEIFVNEAGRDFLDRLEECWESSDCEYLEVPMRTQAGKVLPVDLEAHPIAPPRTAILLLAKPSALRTSAVTKRELQRTRLSSLAAMTQQALEFGDEALPNILNMTRQLLSASYVSIYRGSASKPDYIIEGSLPPEFPEHLNPTFLADLPRITSWTLGQRPNHDIQRAARAAELMSLQTALIGQENAWVGLLVIGWETDAEAPPDSEQLVEIVASLCHSALQIGQLRLAQAENENSVGNLLAELNHQYEAISDTLITIDRSLNILRANSSIARLLGFQPEEVVGLSIQDVLVGPEDVTASLLDAFGHKREAERSKLILHHRDGTPLPIHLRAVPVGSGDDLRLLVVLRDQSEQQAIEDQTEILAQRALLGEVTAIFAHEVRNPINNISTGVQLIASRLGKGHPQFEALDRIRTECVRLDQLMSDVLFFARPLELKMEPLDLPEAMDRILARWMPRFNQSGVRCHTSYDPDTPQASADPRTLERVIVNLISNALEAMTEGGTLSINISRVMDVHDDAIELKVADTGPGIPPDKIDRIFDPFFTTKKDGTGLGLAISRRIMTAHRGTIQVESFPDAGTVFTIHLPVFENDKLQE
jgi:PAS domain S-box-containing protein